MTANPLHRISLATQAISDALDDYARLGDGLPGAFALYQVRVALSDIEAAVGEMLQASCYNSVDSSATREPSPLKGPETP